MNIGTTGILVDQMMQLLVIKRDDTRTYAPPAGALDAGELPTDCVKREVEEETGFKVLPVRLVGVFFRPDHGDSGSLQFSFRCLMRGGEARTSRESLDVGFIPINPIKAPMLAMHKARVEKSLLHHGGRPHWETYQINARERALKTALTRGFYPVKNWVERTFRDHVYVPPPEWQVQVNLVLRNAEGHILWLNENGTWRLPSITSAKREAPWNSAEKLAQTLFNQPIELKDLSGVYNIGDTQQIALVFTADAVGTLPKSAEFHATIPTAADPNHAERAKDAADRDREITLFKRQA